MKVEVAYALPERQWLRVVEVEPGTTAVEAVRRSQIPLERPEVDPWTAPLGRFGQPCAADTVLRAGDRVEIYRPLQVDPKTARRRRAGR